MKNNLRTCIAAALVGLALTGCEKQGALEQAGEEADEAIETIKRGGDESVGAQVDDAVDRAREAGSERGD